RESTVTEIDGRRLTLSNLDKVLYPGSGTTKGEVIAYYAAIAPTLLPHLGTRPITRKRWPDGTASHSFFQKDLEVSAPAWVPTRALQHDDRIVRYPIADSAAVLVWFGQLAALELHVPQWFFGADGAPSHPDRVVFDLDPGPGASLAQCAEVAFAVKDHLDAEGLVSVPVTSGSKGLHLYARVDGGRSSEEISRWAHAVARAVQRRLPTLALSQMSKSLRTGKVFIDWSQNSVAKTTISPYSLRGREHATAAAPRRWSELEAPGLDHLTPDEVLQRIRDDGDLLAALGPEATPAPRDAPVSGGGRFGGGGSWGSAEEPTATLTIYRSKRNRARTPEPVPEPGPLPVGAGNTFVIQEHHARALHWDLRLERDGVLVSWAVPKGIPQDVRANRLAVRTEDHPLEYATFEGSIPHGEYGGGEMTIWDAGTYETEKWRHDEIIMTLRGERASGRFALIRTHGKNWLLHRTRDQPGEKPVTAHRPTVRELAELEPMSATPGTVAQIDDEQAWAFENKWDGVRALAHIRGGELTLLSRNGNDITATYPELAEITGLMGDLDAVLDGEIVACAAPGIPSFSRLQRRMNVSQPSEIARLRDEIPVEFYIFDLLELKGVTLLGKRYDDRRRLLAALDLQGDRCHTPAELPGPATAALAHTRERSLEGIMAKRRDSVYRPGTRSRNWLKLKNFRDLEVIIGGWRPGNGNRAGSLGSLLVGVPDAGRLRYAGKVGTGFDQAALDTLMARLEPLRRDDSPFADVLPAAERKEAVWVDPVVVGEISFVEWTDTHRIRASSWRGLRPDKDAASLLAASRHEEVGPVQRHRDPGSVL
ncbi:MAG: ATP-dependent DNA ligase, partial [Nakamurella sp.]